MNYSTYAVSLDWRTFVWLSLFFGGAWGVGLSSKVSGVKKSEFRV